MVQCPGNRLGAANGQALVVQADALRLPLPDASVDLICTSPPFFALRQYDAGPAQIGSEATPQLFLEALWQATAEMARVLKPSGSMFVNLGDSYYSGKGAPGVTTVDEKSPARTIRRTTRSPLDYGLDYPRKSLMLLPERYRIGCVDRLGLIARAVIVWDKPNGLPESVGDRVRRSHEDWVHLVRSPRYYSAIDEVREPTTDYRASPPLPLAQRGTVLVPGNTPPSTSGLANTSMVANPLGKLPGSVWAIPSEPLRLPGWLGVDHYAAFPSEWPRRLILAFSPPGICLDCGQGRVPVVDRQNVKSPVHGDGSIVGNRNGGPDERGWDGLPRFNTEATILGYACACTPFTDHPERRRPSVTQQNGQKLNDQKAWEQHGGRQHGNDWPERRPVREYHLDRWTPPPTRPAVVLDPFSGTGTTIGVARQLGRIGIGVDLSHAYCRAARYRVFQSGDFGKAVARTWASRQGNLL